MLAMMISSSRLELHDQRVPEALSHEMNRHFAWDVKQYICILVIDVCGVASVGHCIQWQICTMIDFSGIYASFFNKYRNLDPASVSIIYCIGAPPVDWAVCQIILFDIKNTNEWSFTHIQLNVLILVFEGTHVTYLYWTVWSSFRTLIWE